MRRLLVPSFIIAATLVLTACGGGSGSPAAEFDDSDFLPAGEVPSGADPDLAAIYTDVVQKKLPGVSYSLVECAAAEENLNFYHIRLPEATTELIGSFQKDFPFIRVNSYENSGTLLFERFMTEKRAGVNEADIFQTSSPTLMKQAVDEGYVANWTISEENAYPAEAHDSGNWYAFAYVPKVVYLYNTNLISPSEAELLNDWEGIWSDQLASKPLVIPDPAAASGSTLYFYFLEKEFGKESWDKLAAMKPSFLGVTPSAEAVASGEAAMTLTTEGSALTVWSAGAPVRWTRPAPALVDYDPQAVVAKAPHPCAARLFQEYTLGTPGQKIIAQFAYPSVRADIGDQRDVANESWYQNTTEVYDFDQTDYDENAARIVEDWNATFRG
jgi:ABC-type Fe3+ transport system substrate-binding protein